MIINNHFFKKTKSIAFFSISEFNAYHHRQEPSASQSHHLQANTSHSTRQ